MEKGHHLLAMPLGLLKHPSLTRISTFFPSSGVFPSVTVPGAVTFWLANRSSCWGMWENKQDISLQLPRLLPKHAAVSRGWLPAHWASGLQNWSDNLNLHSIKWSDYLFPSKLAEISMWNDIHRKEDLCLNSAYQTLGNKAYKPSPQNSKLNKYLDKYTLATVL